MQVGTRVKLYGDTGTIVAVERGFVRVQWDHEPNGWTARFWLMPNGDYVVSGLDTGSKLTVI